MQHFANRNKNFNYEYLLLMEVINSRDAKAGIFQVQTNGFPGLGEAAKGLGRSGQGHSSCDRSAVLSPRREWPCSLLDLLCSEATYGLLFHCNQPHFHNS